MENAANVAACLAGAIGFSIGAVVVLSRFAPACGLIDHPGGRKAHSRAVPLVGGLAIFIALVATSWAFGVDPRASHFLFALLIVVAAGLWDDLRDISPRLKFASQIAACVVMIWGAGVELRSVGDLLGWRPIGLWIFAAPMTIFAIVGVVNSINMMDGVDGLAGSLGLVAFAWYAAIAAGSGLEAQFRMAVIFCGTIAGFLLFNLRFPWQQHARAFLGDAGSLMIGFALGWFAIDLTQGPGRTLAPIGALWVLLLPLADCVSLMARRVRRGKSPFVADRQHIHHYLQARGFRHGQAIAILVGLSAVFGAVGYIGWRLELAEYALFWPFFFGFFIYHAWIEAQWRKLESQGKAPSSDRMAPDEDGSSVRPV
jgi:UDP-GlcNAc:undecaprenyl-phosphate/decaprenyl-phosphate GlcNAc-1-phosphate transferase